MFFYVSEIGNKFYAQVERSTREGFRSGQELTLGVYSSNESAQDCLGRFYGKSFAAIKRLMAQKKLLKLIK